MDSKPSQPQPSALQAKLSPAECIASQAESSRVNLMLGRLSSIECIASRAGLSRFLITSQFSRVVYMPCQVQPNEIQAKPSQAEVYSPGIGTDQLHCWLSHSYSTQIYCNPSSPYATKKFLSSKVTVRKTIGWLLEYRHA